MGTIDPKWLPDEDAETLREDDEAPGEVPTSFATKGLGWSGRENEGDEDPQD